MEQILLAYDLPKETVTTIMMHYKNTKPMVCSPNSDTKFFDIITEVLQRDTLALYLFIIYLDNILRISIDQIKENCFTLKMTRSRLYPSETMIDTDYTDDLGLLTNTPARAESLLQRMEQAARGISFYVS